MLTDLSLIFHLDFHFFRFHFFSVFIFIKKSFDCLFVLSGISDFSCIRSPNNYLPPVSSTLKWKKTSRYETSRGKGLKEEKEATGGLNHSLSVKIKYDRSDVFDSRWPVFHFVQSFFYSANVVSSQFILDKFEIFKSLTLFPVFL